MNRITKHVTLALFASLLLYNTTYSQQADTLNSYLLPDTVKVISVMQLFHIPGDAKKSGRMGIRTSGLSVYYSFKGTRQEARIKTISGGFFHKTARGMKSRLFSEQNLYWKTKGELPDTVGLYITCARDSASRRQLYSSYLYFPQLRKWKLIGTWQKEGIREYYENLQTALSRQQEHSAPELAAAWYQQHTGVWKELTQTGKTVPSMNPFSSIDSAAQAKAELKYISKLPEAASLQQKEGVYYEILQPGTGKEVKLTDTVTVFYKGYLLEDGTVFDQTDKEPRTFPLTRLIKGWQIGVPLLKTGGKIKLIIPSGIGYGIRTRAAKIPPNSILVFEIEVVKTQ